MRLGIYGGTFDPIHVAHLVIAEHARCELSLTQVMFMPCFIPPHKLDQTISSAHDRLQMVKLAIAGNIHFTVSDYEINKQGASYTIDTLDFFSSQYELERDRLFLIIGADNLMDFEKWRAPERILERATLAIAPRPGSKENGKRFGSAAICRLSAPLMEISASQIRRRVREGGSIRYLTPPNVEAYIREHRLYRPKQERVDG